MNPVFELYKSDLPDKTIIRIVDDYLLVFGRQYAESKNETAKEVYSYIIDCLKQIRRIRLDRQKSERENKKDDIGGSDQVLDALDIF